MWFISLTGLSEVILLVVVIYPLGYLYFYHSPCLVGNLCLFLLSLYSWVCVCIFQIT